MYYRHLSGSSVFSAGRGSAAAPAAAEEFRSSGVGQTLRLVLFEGHGSGRIKTGVQ